MELIEVIQIDAPRLKFVSLLGGFTPAISEELIKLTADKAAPGLCMTLAAAISLAAALLIYRFDGRRLTPAES